MKLVLRGPGPFKSTPDPKNVCYRPRKRPENVEATSFDVTPETVNQGSRAPKIVPGTQNSVLESTKTTRKQINDEF